MALVPVHTHIDLNPSPRVLTLLWETPGESAEKLVPLSHHLQVALTQGLMSTEVFDTVSSFSCALHRIKVKLSLNGLASKPAPLFTYPSLSRHCHTLS